MEFLAFSLFFYFVVENKNVKKIILPVSFVFGIFCILVYGYFQNPDDLNSITIGIEAVLIIIFCIYYFFDQLKKTDNLLIYDSFDFWIIISFLIYFAGTFFLYIYAESMEKNANFTNEYTLINSSFLIIKNILLSIAMFMKVKTKRISKIPGDSLNMDWPDIQSLRN